MKKTCINFVCLFIPIRKTRKKLRAAMRGNPGTKTPFRFRESALAHKYLDGLRGIEIGGSFANGFGLNTLNIDYTDDTNCFHDLDSSISGGCDALRVDIVADGDDLPFKDNVWDFVINSHVLEHFFDPIKTINEWLRVIKPGGILYMIIPHKMRTFDRDRDVTPLSEIIARHNGGLKVQDYAHNENSIAAANETKYILIKNDPVPDGFERIITDNHQHWTVWNTETFLEFAKYMGLDVLEYQDVDDKVGNGFAVVVRKRI